jgi:hypothetical protein
MSANQHITTDFYYAGKNILLPAYQAYTNFQMASTLDSDHKYLQETQEFVKNLCSQHPQIHLKLRPIITDIRPFLWNNFTAIKRYTYIVDLNSITSEALHAIPEYKRWQHLRVVEQSLSIHDIQQHLTFLEHRVLPKRLRIIERDLKEHISELNTLNIIDEQYNVLAQMIFNTNTQHVEQLYYLDQLSFKRKRGGVFAQYAFMWYFKNKGYTQFDFCGANIKSIANYKRRFPGKLSPYYELWYTKSVILTLARKYLLHQV